MIPALLVFAFLAQVAEPLPIADVPVAEVGHATAEVILLPQGEAAPFHAICMTEEKGIKEAKAKAGCAAEVEKLRDTHISPLVIVVVGVAAAVVAAAVTVGVYEGLRLRQP